MSTTFTCQDEFGPHTEHKDCQWILAQMSGGSDDEDYVTAADGTVTVVPRESTPDPDRDDGDDSHYLSGSGERDDDPSYIQYLNNY